MKVKFKIIKKTKEALIQERGEKCERCGRKDELTIDHIIPVAMLSYFMEPTETYQDEYVALMCRPCNRLKSDRIDFADKRAKQILLKLLEKI